MAADVQRELAEARDQFCTCAGRTPPHGPLCPIPTVQRLIADAEKRAAAAELREAERKVRAVYDLQCPVMPSNQYVGAGAHTAHLWWQKVLGGALSDLRDRAHALDAAQTCAKS